MKRIIIIILIILLTSVKVISEEGISEIEILLGQSCALSGPAAALGEGMRAGLLACFEKVNSSGGIKGRKIRLISKDDGYEPQRAIANTEELINEDKVFLLIGEVGTPTSKAVVPIAEEAKIPFVGPFTGAEFLRNPCKEYIINIRASYYQEMEALCNYLTDKKGLKRIACFYQNDSYGQAGLNGITISLRKRNMKLVATGTYERNSIAVKKGLLEIRKVQPEAIVMVGAYEPCAEFIKLSKQFGMKDVVFCNISFVGTKALKESLGEYGDGCIISQVVTCPKDENVPIVKEYSDAMAKYQPGAQKGFVSLEGYMVGKLFCMAVDKISGEITRTKFINTIEETSLFDLGDTILKYGPDDHQGMDDVFLTVVKNGQIMKLGD